MNEAKYLSADAEDGGTSQHQDQNAPKSISSTKISSFYCVFSAFAIPEEDTFLAGNCYRLEAVWENGCVKGHFHSYDRFGSQKDREFQTDKIWMQRIQKIISDYNFVRYNGSFLYVSGLPDMYGSEIRITYASGESICAKNNQDSFIPIRAMEALYALFQK